MSYITKQDLIEELGEDKLIELTDDAGTGEVGDNAVNKAISYAVGTFEAYARTRYTLPVPATEKVKATCLDLAVFHLYKKRVVVKAGVYEVKKESHDGAIKFLQAMQAGKAALDVPAAEETKTNPASADEVLSGPSRPSPFSDDKLRGY